MPRCVARILRKCCLLAYHSRLSCSALPPKAAPLCRRLLPRPSPPRTQHCTAAARRMSSARAAAGGPALAEAKAALVAAIARGREVPTLQTRAPHTGPQAIPPMLQGLAVEDMEVLADPSPQGWVPLRCVHDPATPGVSPRAALLLVHATGAERGSLVPHQARLARLGFLVATLDCRYHGLRGEPGRSDRDVYEDALVRAWHGSGEHPFILDNAWDVSRALDYLESRPDVDATRVGASGVSMGGMIAWFAAAADERLAAVAPLIGVQHFGWAVRQRRYHARVESIPGVFEAAQADRGQPADHRAADPGTVTAVWRTLLPGLAEVYDAPELLSLLAPRPALVVNGELDPRCPMPGVRIALLEARKEYEAHGAPSALRLFMDPGVGHEATPAMWWQVDAFLQETLLLAAD